MSDLGTDETLDASGELISPLPEVELGPRYRRETLLGHGGMGVVSLYADAKIGREVAVKTLRARGPGTLGARARERFLREARIQAQLEHPNIIPVYELGFAEDERPWFSMRRIDGKTLATIIAELRAGALDADARKGYGQRRLLTALSQICLTVDFAHRRGVVHRDLKPHNIMLGEFGEVSLLDWGLADHRGESAALAEHELPIPSRGQELLDLDGMTAVGLTLPTGANDDSRAPLPKLMGTPGYIAPELLLGEPITPAADIYALGAILFELLTLEPLHAGATALAKIQSTLDGAEHRPSERAPQLSIPPEFDELIGRALARDPEQRYASARELHEALEVFLDGQRDEELRGRLAAAHVEEAEALLAASAPGSRRAAIQALSRALALDPAAPRAALVLQQLLTSVPAETPAPVAEAVDGSIADHRQNSARMAAWAYIYTAAYLLPLALWAGVLHLRSLLLMLLALALAAGVGFWAARRERTQEWHSLLLMVVSNLAFALVGVLFGPFIIVPAIVSMNCTAYAMVFTGRTRALAIAFGAFVLAAPVLLEAAGALPPSYLFKGGVMHVTPEAIAFERVPTLTTLAVCSVLGMLGSAIAVGRVRDEVITAERKLQTLTWQISQLVPE